MADELPELLLADAAGWRRWLTRHHREATGVWLVLAKKSVTEPTSLTYDQALDEALCHGWIDGQVGRRDELTYRQRFTPRRARSVWSQINVGRVDRLIASGRMREAGLEQVERARTDGRWQAAYAGSATITVPDDLAAALAVNPAAALTFATLSRQSRYAVLFRIQTAIRPQTRSGRITRLVDMLARGEAP